MAAVKVRHIIIPIAIALTGIVSMSTTAYLLSNKLLAPWKISPYQTVNITFTLQAIILLVSFIALVLMYLYDNKKFKTFFRFGLAKHNWHLYGFVIAITFTAGNAMMMSAGVMAENGAINKTFYSLIPLVLTFAATNAWSEEIFSRFVIVAGLDGKLKPDAICWISAIIFGVPHFFGTPSGLFGVLMSGLLGWLLAKSVIETRGLGWALLIHFLQDLVIFGAGAMIIAGQK